MKTALITGASVGIGAAFAKELASRKMDVVLVARSQDKLEQLAEKLRSQYNIKAHLIPQDLTETRSHTIGFRCHLSTGINY